MAVVVEPARVIAVVCDGTSTSVDSDRASQAAADAAPRRWLAAVPDEPVDPDVAAAFDAARKAVLAMPFVAQPELDPPTVHLPGRASSTDGGGAVASLGDCRSYWVDGEGARQLTTDDSWARRPVASGRCRIEEAMASPQGHAITRWISVDADPHGGRADPVRHSRPRPAGAVLRRAVELHPRGRRPGRRDGPDGGDPSPRHGPPPRRLRQRRPGGHDNITVVVVDLPLPPTDPRHKRKEPDRMTFSGLDLPERVPPRRSGEVHAVVTVTAGAGTAAGARRPSKAVVLIVDTSGSMSSPGSRSEPPAGPPPPPSTSSPTAPGSG